MVLVAESTHFDRLTNLVCIEENRTYLVCKKRKHGGTSVVHVNIVAWAWEGIVYSCARSRLLVRNEREMCKYFAQLYLCNGSSKNYSTNQ